MNNYQLYRTNILLSGQMKWDILLNSKNNTLCIEQFHLSPISNNTSYTYKTDENLINNLHQDNIKAFYKHNKGFFFNECLNPEFTNKWPNICKEGETINTYSNIYDMGCKRSAYFNIYKKQFEFLCPIWLEQLKDNDELSFKIYIKSSNSNTILGSNALILRPNTYSTYHNKFVNYFKNYIKDAELNKDINNDDLININLSNDNASITGLNVNTGLFETKQINNLVQNLTHRERPLMETDNMIINLFPDNNIICKQLFNFNFCFNIEDIFSKNIVKLLYGETIIVSIEAFINNVKLELKDFYTEYEFIPRKFYGDNNESNYSENVLDYLQDNKYISFINKNKYCQNICHWSLCDNNDYIFNLYNGFSGLCIDEENIYENEHIYANTPNTYIENYNKILNNTGWINIYDVYNWNDFNKFIVNNDNKSLCNFIDYNNNYINNIKYKTIPAKLNNIHLLGLISKTDILTYILENYKSDYLKIFETDNVSQFYVLFKNNILILLTNNINNITFANFYKYISNSYKQGFNDVTNLYLSGTNPNKFTQLKNRLVGYLTALYNMLSTKIDPQPVYISNSLMYTNAKSPDYVSTTEIDYIKEDNVYNYVIRYDGKIKPTFTSNVNTLYYKDYVSNGEQSKLKNSNYFKYNGLAFEPTWPSINFCSIKKLNNWSREQYPTVKVTEYDSEVYILGNNFEYKWFNENKCIVLNTEIIFNEEKNINDNKTIDSIIETKLRTYYNIEDNNLLAFIKNMYDYTVNWEYSTNTSIENYTYTIKLKLNFNKNK